MKYSVLTEPVIPVVMPDGENRDIGVREAFINAHNIRDIRGDMPLERYALLRLLIAFAMDMLHPEDSYERRDILEKGCFDAGTFDEYISMCEKDGPRFDLFDERHPFMQSRYDESLDAKAIKPVANLFQTLPTGNNHIFLDHRLESEHEKTPTEAFRGMCCLYLFCTAGAQGYPSGVNNTPPVYTVIRGINLFETIVFNMLSVSEAGNIKYGIGDVLWRNDISVIPKEEVADITLLEALTFMPRRITLKVEEDSVVRNVFLQQGRNFKGNDSWHDPHVPQFRKNDGSFGTVKPELGKDLWRDVGTMLYDETDTRNKQPLVLRCIINLFDYDELPTILAVRAVGLVTNQAAYTEWYEDELALPAILLCDQEKADVFREDVKDIEFLQNRIQDQISKHVDKPREGSKTTEHETALQCKRYFLQAAHDFLFGAVMDDILSGSDEKTHVELFAQGLKDMLSDMIRNVLYSSGSDVNSMRKQLNAESAIWSSYYSIIKEREEAYAGQ